MPYRAGFWIRVLATIIDWVSLLIIAIAVGAVFFSIMPAASERAVETAIYIAWLGYTSFEIWTAATPGKMLLRLRISEQDCSPAEFWRRVLRWSTKQYWMTAYLYFLLSTCSVLYAIGGFSSLVVTFGCLFAANDDRLTWHDQWAHTAVCYRPRSQRRLAHAPIPPPLPPSQAPPTT
jgi:uncharacterized RDD family membrane protein YckC